MQDNLTSLASLPSVHVRQNCPEDGRFLVSSIGCEKKGEPRKGAGRLEPMRRRTMQLILGGIGKAKNWRQLRSIQSATLASRRQTEELNGDTITPSHQGYQCTGRCAVHAAAPLSGISSNQNAYRKFSRRQLRRDRSFRLGLRRSNMHARNQIVAKDQSSRSRRCSAVHFPFRERYIVVV
jgi:hypothetical protein